MGSESAIDVQLLMDSVTTLVFANDKNRSDVFDCLSGRLRFARLELAVLNRPNVLILKLAHSCTASTRPS